MSRVQPSPPQEEEQDAGFLSISNLSPDLNNDGKVEPWERDVFDRLKRADLDGDGKITRHELFTVIKSASAEIEEMATKGGITISSLDPDTDGDGKVEPWETEVFNRIKAADADGSGSINVKEVRPAPPRPFERRYPPAHRACMPAPPSSSPQLFGVIKGAAESDKQKRMFKNLFFVVFALLIIMIGANTALSVAVTVAFKDVYTGSSGVSATADGNVIRPGGYSVSGSQATSRNRRLKQFHGRTLVQVGSTDTAACTQVLNAQSASGEVAGNAQMTTSTGTRVWSGSVTETTSTGGTSVVTVEDKSGNAAELHDCGAVYLPVNGRLRELTTDEAHRSRRRLSASLDDEMKPVHVGCVVYHCFEGDEACEAPSPRSACAEWEADGARCLEPLCQYVMKDDKPEL
jgi:hypothetical protein